MGCGGAQIGIENELLPDTPKVPIEALLLNRLFTVKLLKLEFNEAKTSKELELAVKDYYEKICLELNKEGITFIVPYKIKYILMEGLYIFPCKLVTRSVEAPGGMLLVVLLSFFAVCWESL